MVLLCQFTRTIVPEFDPSCGVALFASLTGI